MTETTAPVQSLHDQIMRLPCTPPKDANVNQSISYKSGHRDARHAAAELAAEHEAEQQQELTAIEAMARMLADGEWAEHVGQLGGPIAQRLETEITRMHNEQQAAPVAVPDENGLLPCPFCGGNAELHQRETESLWSHNQVTWSQVGCCECECVGADCCEDDDGSEAAAHWNTRAAATSAPTPPAQQPLAWVLFHNGEVAYDRDELIICNLPCDRLDESYEWRRVYAAPPAQQSQADGRRDGIEAVAKMIEKQASDYAMEFGHDDLGALSFGAGPHAEAKHDHYSTLCELAEEVRAMLAAPGDTAAPDQPKCKTCGGTGFVDDGEIWCSEGGIPYENGPVKCVKDCPECSAPPEQAEQPKCNVCRDVGIVGHSDICPACSDSWQPPAERAEQPAGTTSDQYRADLYDEVWQKARNMGYGNVTEALVELERAKAQTEQPVRWGSTGTVGNLIAQLRTIDPGMPVYASLRVKNGVRDGVMLNGLVISYEHGDGRFIVKDGPEKCVVIWTQPDDRHAEQDAEWVEKAMEQAQVFASAWSLVGGQFDAGDGLEHAKEEKQRLRALLEGGR